MSKNKKGFTLIELLIVIALLGALAVGLLAAVDPFEQLKKGTDTSTRNTAAEYFNALIRFYAQRDAFPTGITTSLAAGTAVYPALSDTIAELASAGELKADFIQLAGTGKLNKITVSVPAPDKIVVCVNPESKAFRNDKNAIYNATGGTQGTSCPNPQGSNCFICFF